MLARMKKAEPLEPLKDATYFRRALKLPLPTVELTAAEKASREAAANLRTVVDRREKMKVEATVENPVKEILPTEITRRTLADIETQIVAAQALDREARAEFERKKALYEERVRERLAGDIESLGATINRRLDETLELLDIAAALGAEAREARVEVPGLVKDAASAKHLIETVVVSTIAKMTRKGSPR